MVIYVNLKEGDSILVNEEFNPTMREEGRPPNRIMVKIKDGQFEIYGYAVLKDPEALILQQPPDSKD